MEQKSSDITFLTEKAKIIRRSIVEMISLAKSGHPGGSLSLADIMTCLYFSVMNHDPDNPQWTDRDRLHLSKGHACPVWYSVLAECGYFDKKHLSFLRKLGSLLQGHPDRRVPGVDVASGSLGQGLSVALGMALAGKLDKKDYTVYCIMGDGELQEGNIWEAAMAVSHFKLDNLCAIIDYNKFQIDGRVDEIMNIAPLEDKWKAFGWHVIVIDGHDIKDILRGLNEAKKFQGKPSVIIANTIKGKGVSFMENTVDFHGRAPSGDEIEAAFKELKG